MVRNDSSTVRGEQLGSLEVPHVADVVDQVESGMRNARGGGVGAPQRNTVPRPANHKGGRVMSRESRAQVDLAERPERCYQATLADALLHGDGLLSEGREGLLGVSRYADSGGRSGGGAGDRPLRLVRQTRGVPGRRKERGSLPGRGGRGPRKPRERCPGEIPRRDGLVGGGFCFSSAAMAWPAAAIEKSASLASLRPGRSSEATR